MKQVKFISALPLLLLLMLFGAGQAQAQCPPAPAGCPGCALVNPIFITSQGNETCVGLADGQLQFLNLAFLAGMNYPLTFEWYSGSNCSGAIISSGTVSAALPSQAQTIADATLTGLSDGESYTIVVYDGTFYSYFTYNIGIINIPPNQPVISPDPVALCPGASAVLTASEGGGGEAWDAADSLRWYLDGVLVSGPNAALTVTTYTVTGPGQVYVTVDNGTGCLNTSDTVVVTQDQMTINTTVVDVDCNGSCNGSVTNVVSGGSAPFTYNWSANTAPFTVVDGDLSNACADTYTLTITDNNSCDTVMTFDIQEPPAMAATFPFVSDPSCNGVCDGTVTINVTGGTGAYTYSWQTNNANNSITQGSLCDGTENVTITDGNGCILNESVTVTEPNPIDPVPSATDETCDGDCDGTANSTPTGGTAPYSFAWSNGGADGPAVLTSDIITLCPGTYTVTVEDANGCTEVDSATVAPAVPLTCSAVGDDPDCNGASDGTIDVTAGGGNPGYTFDWSDIGIGPEDRTGLSSGTYTVTITDLSGCNCVTSATLNDPAGITYSPTEIDPTCNGFTNGAINASTAGGTPTYIYDWSDIGIDNEDRSGLGAGTYTVTVTDFNGCTVEETMTITDPPAIVLDTATTSETCAGDCDGTATVTATGGDNNFSYLWSNAQITPTATGLCAGNYDVTVTDGNLCQADTTLVVNGPTPFNVVVNTVEPVCNGSCTGTSIALVVTGGTPGYTYTWSGTGTVNGTPIQSDLCAGTYDVTVADANACDTTFSVTLNQPAPYDFNFTAVNPNCGDVNDGTATITMNSGGTAPYTFSWSTGPADNNVNTSSINGLAGGAYDVTITDAQNCDSVHVFTITQPVLLNIDTTGVTSASCVGLCDGTADAVTTGGTGAVTVMWENTLTGALGAGPLTTLCPGDQIFAHAVDANGCRDTTVVFVVDTLAIINLNLVADSASCPGVDDGQIAVTVTGGAPMFTYSWDNGSTTMGPSPGTETGLAGSLGGVTYVVTVTDAGGCQAVDSAMVFTPTALSLVNDTVDATCAGGTDGTAGVVVSGGTPTYTYIWDDPGAQTTATATGLGAGTYCVTVTDASGCTETTCIDVSEPTGMTINTSVTDLDCNSICDGQVQATPNGGIGPYDFVWSNGVTLNNANTSTISSLCANDYTVTVTDANGCTTQVTETVTEPALLVASDGGQVDNTCFGDGSGSATVNAAGGTGTYTFQWNTGTSNTGGVTNTETGLAAGDYTVTVEDGNGCTDTQTYTITEGVEITYNFGSIDEQCDGACDGSAGVLVTSAGTHTYDWSHDGALTNDTATFLCPNSYTVTITDQLGCDTTQSFTINAAPAITLATAVTDESCLGVCDGSIVATGGGGTPPYDFAWSDGFTENGVLVSTNSALCAATYDVTLTDANGCQATDNGTVADGVTVAASVATTDNTCGFVFPGCIGDATVTVTSPSANPADFNFTWDDPMAQTTDVAVSLCGGNYNVTVEHTATTCQIVLPAVLSDIGGETITVNSTTDVDCNGDCNGEAVISYTNNSPPLTLEWLDDAGVQIPAFNNDSTPTGMCPGLYFARITNSVGCITIDSVEIMEPDPFAANDSIVDLTCNGDGSGEVYVFPTGGTGAYTYQWNVAPFANQHQIGVAAGDYTVTITDANACDTVFTFTIAEPAAITINTTTSTDETCFNDCDGTVSVNASGGTPTLTFNWINNTTSLSVGSGTNVTGLCPDDYFVSITDANGCNLTSGLETVGTPGDWVYTTDSTDVTCNGDDDGTVTINITAGGTAPLTYSWTGGQSTPTATGLAGGTYTVVVTDANNCTVSEEVSVNEPTVLDGIIATTDIVCAGECTGQAEITPSGGSTPYTFQWSTGGTNSVETGICAGDHNLQLSDANGCITLFDPVTINTPDTIRPNATVGDETCFGDCDGSIILAATGGTGTLDYNWNTGSTASSIGGLCPGNYTVTITDDNLCDTVVTFTVNGDPALAGTPGPVSDATCGNLDGSATMTASGGAGAPYTYNWFNSVPALIGSGPTQGSLGQGVYNIEIIDVNSCRDTFPLTINEIGAETIDQFDSTQVSCFGQCDGVLSAGVSVPISAPLTFEWFDVATSTSQGPSVTGVTADTISFLCEGDYFVQVTNSANCVSTRIITVNDVTAIDPGETLTHLTCSNGNDGAISLSPSGGNGPAYNFNWDGGSTAQNRSSLSAGDYTVTITETGPFGCQVTETFTLTQPGAINATLSTVDLDCNGDTDGQASVVASGGTGILSYSWFNGFNASGAQIGATTTTTTSQSALSAGQYSLIVADGTGVCDTLIDFEIFEPNVLSLDSLDGNNNNCFGDCLGNVEVGAVGGTGPFNYQWSGNTGGQTGDNAIGLCAGTYTVTVTDFNSCQATDSYTVTEGSPITLTSGQVEEGCFSDCDGSAGVDVTGGNAPFNYQWSANAISSTNDTVFNLCPDTYTLTITDNNTCDSVLTFVITGPNELTVPSAAAINLTCNNDSNAVATVNPSGGTPTYTYLWDASAGNQTTQTATGLHADTYGVTVTDANGCAWDSTITVTEPAAIGAVLATSPATCLQVPCDGSASATPSGGTAPFTYAWNDPLSQTNDTAFGLCSGTYSVTITDSFGCDNSFGIGVSDVGGDTINVVAQTDATCNGDCDGEVTITHTCSTGPGTCTLEWLDSALDTIVGYSGSLNPTGMCAGTYYAQVQNAVGCITLDTVVITEPDPVLPNETITDVSCNGDTDGSVTTAASGGDGSYTYQWSNLSSAPGIFFRPAGDYTLTLTDGNGCADTSTFTIADPPVLTIDAVGSTDITCNGLIDGTLSAAASGGTGTLTYTWVSCTSGLSVGSGQILGSMPAGQYLISVEDASGCFETSACETISEPGPIVLTTDSNEVTCFGDLDGEAIVAASGGTGAFTYQWDVPAGSQTTATAFNLGIGTYDVTVQDANGCQEITSVEVTGPNDFTMNPVTTDVACFGETTGDATVNVIGGTSPYSFQWDGAANNQTSQTATGLSNGNYDVTVTDNRGCDSVITVTIASPPVLDPSVVETDEECAGNCDGEASVVVTGGTPPFNYLWDAGTGNQTDSTAIGLCPGSYDVTLTDNNGCDSVLTANIVGLTAVNVAIVTTNATCGLSDGTATATITGGTGPYNTIWYDQAFAVEQVGGTSISGLAAGIYFVEVSSVSSSGGTCIDTTQFTVVNTGAEVLDAMVTSDVSCFGICDGVSTAFVQYPLTDGPITYEWFDELGVSIAQTDTFATGLCAGIYNVQITNNSGCITVGTDTVDSPTEILANAVVTDVDCSGDLTGQIATFPSGGTGPAYTFLWSNTSNASGISGLANGQYEVTISDPDGCMKLDTFVVSAPPALAAVMDTVGVLCNGDCNGEASVVPSGGVPPYTYTWDDPLAQIDSLATGLCPGTYNLDLEDANGCLLEPAAVEVLEPPLLATSITDQQDANCFSFCDGLATVTPTGGTPPYTYDWDDPALQTDSTATGLCAGNFNVTVTDANGCTSTETVDIDEPAELILTMDSSAVSCFGDTDGSATVTPTGGTPAFTYLWNDPSSQTDSMATGLLPGVYSVDVTDGNGCVLTSASVNVTEPSQITGTPGFVSANCMQSDGSAIITPGGGTPGFTYQWDVAAGSQTDSIATGLAAGNYDVTVTDASGCTDSFTASIPNIDGPNIDTMIVTNVLCYGDSTGIVDIEVSGANAPFTYNWSTGATSQDLTNLPQGSYPLTVTDNQGCITLDTATITQPDSIEVNYTVSLALCGLCNGTIDAEVTGGVMPYSYDWYNAGGPLQIGQTDTMAIGLCIGSYFVEITDGNGCVVNAQDTSVAAPDDLTFSLDSINVVCNGDSTGSAIATILTGVAPYGIQWDFNAGGVTTDTASALPAGTYCVTISDANCTIDTCLSIGEPDAITASLGSIAANCLQSDGAASVTPSGGTGAFTYQWDAGAANQTDSLATGLAAGTYSVSVSDASSCLFVDSVNVGNINAPVVDAVAITDILCHGDSLGAVDITVSGANPPFTYNWTNGVTDQDIDSVVAGQYVVTITDNDGCITFDTSVVSQPDSIVVAYITTEATCGGCNATADAEVTGGVMPYSYDWYNATSGLAIGQTDTLAIGLCIDSYFVEITDGNGCIVNAQDTMITTPDSLVFTLDSINVLCSGDSTGSAIVDVSSFVAPLTIQWDANALNATTDTVAGLPAGIYCLTITDANCVVDTCLSIGEPEAIDANTNASNITCSNDCDGEISSTPSGGSMPYTYNWSTGATDSLITGLCQGTYTVTINDASGCAVIFEDSVIAPNPIDPSVVVTGVLCNGDSTGTAVASASGGTAPFSYNWSNGHVGTNAVNLPAGVYMLTVADANACDTVVSVSVVEPDALSDSIVQQQSTCGQSDGELTAHIDGGTEPYSFEWLDNVNNPIGQTDSTATGLGAGFYKVVVTDANLCVDTFAAPLSDLGAETLVADSIAVSCYDACDGAIFAASQSCASPACILEWFSATSGLVIGNTDTVSNLCAGDYYGQIVNGLGCIVIDQIEVTQPQPIEANTDTTLISCNGLIDGALSVTPTGGNGTVYAYLWSTTSTDSVITGLGPGTYTVTITAVGPPACDTTYSITLVDPPLLTATTDSTDISCFGECDGTTTVHAIGGHSPYTYLWDAAAANQTDSTATGLCQGSYSVTVTDDGGCTHVPAPVTVNEPTLLTATISNFSDVLCAGECSGSGTVTPAGGTAPYNYLWEAAAGSQTDSVATGLCAGTYVVTVTDAGGCTAVDSVIIDEPTSITATFTNAPASCFDVCDGQSLVIPTGGTPGYTYVWGTALMPTDSLADSLCAGTYNVSVTDAAGCLAVFSTTITEPQPIAAVMDTTQANCNMADGAAAVIPSGGNSPYTYLWNDPLAQTDSLATGLFANIYQVTVTDSMGCSDVFSAFVGNIDGPVPTLQSLTDATCNGYTDGAINISVTGGTAPYEYQWLSGQTQQDISNLGAGVYVVSITDVPGCVTFANYTIAEPDTITGVVNTANATCGECNGQSEVIPAGGNGAPFTYLWSNNATTATADSLCPGVYAVDVFDSLGCVQSFTNIGVSDIGGPTSDSILVTPATCFGDCNGSAEIISVSGGTQPYTYNWIPGGSSSTTLNGLCAGLYTVEVLDSLGCALYSTIEVTQPAQITDSVVILATECGQTNGSLALYPENGGIPYSFSWSNGSGNPIDDAISTQDTGLAAGVYVITVTGASGCSEVFSYTLNASDAPVLTTASAMPGCFAGSDGTATVSATGGTGAYTYIWEDLSGNPIGQSDSTATGLAAGDYVIHVQDAVPCDAYAIVTVDEPDSLIFTSPTTWDASCANLCDGAAAVVLTGGTLPYAFQWDADAGNQVGNTATGLCDGTFNVTVTDANGCAASDSITIFEPAPIVITVDTVEEASCIQVNDGFIEISIAGGNAPYSAAWTGPNAYTSDSVDIHNLFPGPYVVAVTDTNNCMAMDTVVVDTAIVIEAFAGLDTTVCVLDSSLYVYAAEFSGNPNITFEWQTADGTVLGTNDSLLVQLEFPQVDSILVLYAIDNACFDRDTVVVHTVGLPPVEAGADVSIIAGTEVELGPTGTVNTAYDYSWSPNISINDSTAPKPTVAPLESTTYYVTVEDEYGCYSIDSVFIEILPDVDFPTGFSPNGDGVNDVWLIDFINRYPDARVEVYNRWGQQLFVSPPGYPDPWDGTFNGNDVPVGTYYYIIDLNEPDAPAPITGPLTIVR